MFEQIDSLEEMARLAPFVGRDELASRFLKVRVAWVMTDQPDRAIWGLRQCEANPHPDDLVQACLACAWALLIDRWAPEGKAAPKAPQRLSKGQLKRSRKFKHV